MLKRVIIFILIGLIFCSCEFIGYTRLAIQDNIYRIKEERDTREWIKKDAPGAIFNDKYKEEVKDTIQDIIKRPINKRVEFEETTLLIPENTRINLKHGNIVDEITGYGIRILFKRDNGCTPATFYTKKIRDDLYIRMIYNNKDKELTPIGQKIIKANGFTNTCK